MNNQFKIGDRVIGKKTGPINTGRILNIMDAGLYCVNSNIHPINNYWAELYPDWLEKPVYQVSLDKPSRNVSREEFVSQSGLLNIDEKIVDIAYQMKIPILTTLAFPEEDLELYG